MLSLSYRCHRPHVAVADRRVLVHLQSCGVVCVKDSISDKAEKVAAIAIILVGLLAVGVGGLIGYAVRYAFSG